MIYIQCMQPFFIDLPLPELPRLTHLGWQRITGEMKVEEHRHLGYEIVYFSDGVATVNVNGGESFPVGDGDLLITAPNIAHHFLIVSQGIHWGWLGFQLEKVVRTSRCSSLTLEETTNGGIQELNDPSPTGWPFLSDFSSVYSTFVREPLLIHCLEAEPVFQSLIEEYEKNRRYAATIVYSRLLELLSIIARHMQETQTPLDLSRAMDLYIEAHLGESLTLKRLADHIGYNPCYLSHLFKTQTGMTIFENITQKRMERAKHLISMGFSVTEAAAQCGYADVHHFSAAFKRLFGVSPSMFRGVISPPQILSLPS
jgi:AraC-like DNA-binding protein